MDKIHKKQGKTTAKSLGLKTVLKIDDQLVVSTFGKQTKPMVVEQSINKSTGEKDYYVEKESAKFDSSFDRDTNYLNLTPVNYKNNLIKVNIDNKDPSEIGMDYLRLKPVLEQEFFGKTYNDNVHIQIAYNLLDLKKIIGLHIGNVIQSLNNLSRENVDLVGICSSDKPLAALNETKQKIDIGFLKKLSPYYMYFDGALKLDNSKNKDEGLRKTDIDNWNTVRSLSLVRQGCAHSGENSVLLYNFQDKPQYADLARHTQNMFKEDLTNFNKSFLNNNRMNMYILFGLYNCAFDDQTKKRLSNEFYRFSLYKDSKNLGFSLKTIRNKIIEGKYDEKERAGKLQTIRPKLNILLDFYLYKYYNEHPTTIESIVSKLRESKNEDDKEKIYEKEYKRLLSESNFQLDKKCGDIVYKINKAVEHKSKTGFNVVLEDVRCSDFPSLIYLLCKFLDGKEVNELTTSLINKLENIGSLIDALIILEKWDGFSDQYKIFDNDGIKQLIDDFRMVKNLSASKRKLKKANGQNDKVGRQLYADAINMFKKDNFVSVEDEKGTGLDSYINRLFGKDDAAGKKVRNLLLSSIVKNRRFIYLIKYIDPKDCYRLVHNEKILRFVLGQYDENQMPLNQLQRYYDAVVEKKEGFRMCNDRKKMIDVLVGEISNISMEKILGFGDKLIIKGNNTFVDHQKQIISLYLTIAFLVVKGIVHTNSIYFIAWSAFERDYSYKYSKSAEDKDVDYFALDNDYLSNKKPRVKQLIQHNIEEANKSLSNKVYRQYRNKVMHLNLCNEFVRYIDDIGSVKTYFDVYSYVVQRWCLTIDGGFIDNDYRNKLESDLNQYNAYQRNFLKIINLPFAYNLARYKNLTIGDLFNDKYPIPKEVIKEYYNEE